MLVGHDFLEFDELLRGDEAAVGAGVGLGEEGGEGEGEFGAEGGDGSSGLGEGGGFDGHVQEGGVV